ncbi:MAG: hypothetical protein KGI26_03620 [Thaumarchaeota archaeon]|nr:hypothetical protein [Nitrososphaerota archaeon]
MPQDPGSIFGGLLNVCVSDEHIRERRLMTEGVLCVALGLATSFVTTYVLSAAGFLL